MSRDPKRARTHSQGKSGHPMMVGVFIGVLAGLCLALGVALYLNKSPTPFVPQAKPGNGERTAPPKTAPKFEAVKPGAPASATAAAAPAQDGKPTPPKTRLDFYTILPGKEEVVPERDVKKSPAAGDARVVYYLQAGAFQTAPDADNLKARLALAGLEAQIQTATLPDNSIWHRVRMGPYQTTAELDAVRATLKQNKIDSAVIKVNEPLAKR